jgi:hypothetical protein
LLSSGRNTGTPLFSYIYPGFSMVIEQSLTKAQESQTKARF